MSNEHSEHGGLSEHGETGASNRANETDEPNRVDETAEGILFIGSIMVDIVCNVQKLPMPGEGVVADSTAMTLGGCANNACSIAKQLGARASLFAPLGIGPYANFAKKQLAAKDMQGIQIDTQLDCGAAICLVTPDGERTMVTIPGIERQFEKSWFDGFDMSGYGIAYVCGYELGGTGGSAILEFLGENPQVQTVFAPGPVICKLEEPKIRKLNEMRSIWHLNEMEAMTFTGIDDAVAAGTKIARDCGNTAIITEGSKGAHLFQHESDGSIAYALVPTQKIRPVDTVGAGDSHVGTLLAARAHGKDWEESAAIANEVAAAVCQVKGAILTDEEFAALDIRL